ncbi:peptidase associated/transthyretin-like domain-containing protein [Streptomyces ferrugineus]|uniref:hypothetical protein n=1 Tax=Streptomyces ferrugineus TaxID=1413221 RepID=UPI00389AC01D
MIDSETCKPIRNAAVDIWHCNALGVYSGYESMGGGVHEEPTDDERYLRGTWRTDKSGQVVFKTGQLFFDEDNGTEGGLLKLKCRKNDIAKGVVATITMGVDPEATNTGT